MALYNPPAGAQYNWPSARPPWLGTCRPLSGAPPAPAGSDVPPSPALLHLVRNLRSSWGTCCIGQTCKVNFYCLNSKQFLGDEGRFREALESGHFRAHAALPPRSSSRSCPSRVQRLPRGSTVRLQEVISEAAFRGRVTTASEVPAALGHWPCLEARPPLPF